MATTRAGCKPGLPLRRQRPIHRVRRDEPTGGEGSGPGWLRTTRSRTSIAGPDGCTVRDRGSCPAPERNEGGNTDTGDGILLKGVKQALAIYENYQRTERSRRGKVGRAKAGSVLVAAQPPYGYRSVAGD